MSLQVIIYRFHTADVMIFHAGTKFTLGKLTTSGGRVLAVTGLASDLKEALNRANTSTSLVKFNGAQFRRDIGHRALAWFQHRQASGATYADAGVNVDAGNLLVE